MSTTFDSSKVRGTGCKILDTVVVDLTLAFPAEVKPYKFPQLFQFLGEFEYRMRTDKGLSDWQISVFQLFTKAPSAIDRKD